MFFIRLIFVFLLIITCNVGAASYPPEDIPTSPIHKACFDGDLELLKSLIKEDTDLNVYDEFGTTPLIYSVKKSKNDILKFLIESGCNVNQQSKIDPKSSPIQYAIWNNNLIGLKLLLENGGDPFYVNQYAYSNFGMAVSSTNTQAASLLLKYGVDINLKNKDELNVLQSLLEYFGDTGNFWFPEYAEMTRFLVNNGLEVDSKTLSMAWENIFNQRWLGIVTASGTFLFLWFEYSPVVVILVGLIILFSPVCLFVMIRKLKRNPE